MAGFETLLQIINGLQQSRPAGRDCPETVCERAHEKWAADITTSDPSSVDEVNATLTRAVAEAGLAAPYHGVVQSSADPITAVEVVDVIMSDSGDVEIPLDHSASFLWPIVLDDEELEFRGSDDNADFEEDAELSQYEAIDDTEVLADVLLRSCLCPSPRARALYRRAASGKGLNAQLLRASGMI